MAVSTVEQARADLARVAVGEIEARAIALSEERRQLLPALEDGILAVDDLMAGMRASNLVSQPDGKRMLAEARAVRASLFERMRDLNPEDAWFWTEEWQAGEREVDANIAAGTLIHYDSGEEFLAYLRERRPDVADL